MPTSQRRRKDRAQTHQGSITPATVLNADPLRSAAQGEREPAHRDIARRAFQRFEARGHEHGKDVDDWLEAEREVRQQQPETQFVRSEGDYDDAA